MSDNTSVTLSEGCTACHCWLIGPTDRTRQCLGIEGPGPDSAAPASRPSPETGVSIFDCRPVSGDDAPVATPALVREVVPWMLEHDPAAIRRTHLTVYMLAPGLTNRLDEAPPSNHHWRDWNLGELLRLGHGLCELLHSWGAAAGSSTLVFEEVHLAGTVDALLIARMLRELPAELVRIVVCSGTDHVLDALRSALIGTRRCDLRRPPDTVQPA